MFLFAFLFTAIAFKVVINQLYAVGVQKGYAPKQPAGDLGRKSGQGFYQWDEKKALRPRLASDTKLLEG